MNAEHKFLYQETKTADGYSPVKVEVKAHKWVCGSIGHYVLSEVVIDIARDDFIHEREIVIPDHNTDAYVQRYAIKCFDELVKKYLPDAYVQRYAIKCFDELVKKYLPDPGDTALPLAADDLPFSALGEDEDEFPW